MDHEVRNTDKNKQSQPLTKTWASQYTLHNKSHTDGLHGRYAANSQYPI